MGVPFSPFYIITKIIHTFGTSHFPWYIYTNRKCLHYQCDVGIVCFCDCTMPHLFPIITPTSNLWAESLRMCNVYIHSFGIQHIIHSVCVCLHVFNSSASYCVSCYMMDFMYRYNCSRIDSSRCWYVYACDFLV